MFTTFEEIFAELRSRGARKRMVAAWGVDSHTIAAAAKAVELGLADVTLVGDENLIAQACKEEDVDMSIFTIVKMDISTSSSLHAWAIRFSSPTSVTSASPSSTAFAAAAIV